ncbi:MAG: trehalose-phosphatase [Candidatus Acidiferrales bacterium]
MRAPKHLFAAQDSLRRAVRRARRVMLLTDFDGTLAPLRRRPGQVRLSRSNRRLLGTLARRGVTVAIVSGRPLRDLRARVGLRGVWYVGVHGFFLQIPSNRSLSLLNRRERRRIAQARRRLKSKLAKLKGIRVEAKQATVAVHFRGAPRASAARAGRALAELLQRERNLRLLSGKKVWEIFPRRNVSKWTAVQFILEREGWNRAGGGGLAFYLGDDVTDEDVFRHLNGVTVAVGKRRGTAARYYLRSPAEAHQFLEMLKSWLA